MRKVLITGGLGFIGRHLVRHFQSMPKNYQLTIIDDLSGSKMTPNTIAEIRKTAEVRIEDFLQFNPEGWHFDDLYHLASPVGAIGILAKSGKIAKQIIDLAEKATEVSIKCNARLMYISSSEIYYASPNQQENSEIILNIHHGARIEYAMGKYCGEVLVRNMGISKNLDFNICRPFNLIGEEQSSQLGFVVPRFFEACLSTSELEVFGDGTQERSFCDVKDFVHALVAFQESGLLGETLNIGNINNRTTILALAEQIKTITKSDASIKLVDPKKKYGNLYMEGGEKLANTEKAQKLIGLNLSANLEETLRRIHVYFLNLPASDLS
jgi:nucleoside-diphosphate-sugar epimerase